MTTEKKVPLGPLARCVAGEVRRLRELRRLSYNELAKRLGEVGRPIPAVGLRRIENGDRRVDVDELLALSVCFGIADPWSLTKAASCPVCSGRPPPGFRCLTCGGERSPASPQPPPAAQHARSGRGQVHRRRMTRALLHDVAKLYRSALAEGEAPTMAVADHYGVSHRTAGRWVGEARQRGELGLAKGPTPGEVAPEAVTGPPTPR